MKVICEQCGQEFDATNRRGITPRFCSATCRQRAHRARKARQPLSEFHRERRWVRADGKRPIMPCGSPASSTDPATWSRFSDAQAGAGDGFGVMLGNGLGCYDIDHCLVDGKLEPWARLFIELIPEKVVYSEISRSGDGVHLFFLSDSEGRGSKENGVERYTMDRFIRCTFNDFIL